jgi:hypothetical protein
MAQRTRRAVEFEDEGPGSAILARFLVWAGLTAIALGSAALAAQTQTGAERIARIIGNDTPVAAHGRLAPRANPATPSDSELEARRLADTVRALAADRDRLLARLDALERNMDVTGSIPRENPAPPASATSASAPLPATWSLVPSTIPPAAGIPAASMPPGGASGPATSGASAPGAPAQQGGRATGGLFANEQAAESVATKTEFAVDVGGDATLDGLRALWTSIKGHHAAAFEGLRPVVAVREGAKPGALELRLVVGPLANAGAAARLCATLAAAGQPCQPTVFDGQRLALR